MPADSTRFLTYSLLVKKLKSGSCQMIRAAAREAKTITEMIIRRFNFFESLRAISGEL